MEESVYRGYVRDVLDLWSERLINELNELSELKFYEGIDLLDFEIHYKCDIYMYTMTRDGNEYSPLTFKEGYYSGGRAFVKGLDRQLNREIDDYTDEYELFGGDSYMASSKEAMLWFTDCWYKSECSKIKLPVYVGIHDHMPLYDVINRKWLKSGQQWF